MVSRRGFLAVAASVGAANIVPARAAATVSIVSTIDDTVTPVLYAVRAGLFEQAGLNVTLERLGSGTAITSAVLAGAYNIGKSSVLPLFHAHLKGLPVAILAPAGVYDAAEPFALMLVARDSPVTGAKDLNGKIVGTPALDDLDDLSTVAWVGQTAATGRACASSRSRCPPRSRRSSNTASMRCSSSTPPSPARSPATACACSARR